MWRFLGVLLMATSALSDRTFIQNLLDSDLTGEELYGVYDEHYDALSPADQLKEKGTYPKRVYEELLEHRKHLYQPPPPKNEEKPPLI